MFTYDTGDIISGVLVAILIIALIYKTCRYYYYIKIKYKTCPCCGAETGTMTKTNYSLGDQDSYTEIYCRRNYIKKDENNIDKKCDWTYNIRF